MDITSSMTSEQIVTKQLVGEALTISDVTVNTIESNNPPQVPDAIITRSVLDDEMSDIHVALKSLDPEGDLFQDLSVISLSLVDTYFSKHDDWVFNNWSIVDNYMYYDSGSSSNSLSINPNRFSSIGHYYLLIDVGSLNSGRIDVLVNNNWIASIRETGEHIVNVTIDDPASDVVSLVAVDVPASEHVRLDFFGLYFLTDRFYKYFTDRITNMAEVNPDNYVTKDYYEHTQDTLAQQFRTLTGNYLSQLTTHINANNPHHITPDSIGAAPANHTHDYIDTATLENEMSAKLRDYALVNHTHDNYMTRDDSRVYISNAIDDVLYRVKTITPFIVTNAPQGKLPSRYAQTDVTPPSTILVPSIVSPTDATTFDYNYGLTSTNIESLIDIVPQVFSADMSAPAVIPVDVLSDVVNFRLEFNHDRSIAGYRIHCFGSNKLIDWRVINGNTTFIHRVTNPANYITNGNDNICEIMFDHVITLDMISFMFLGSYTGDDTEIRLKIELIYSDINKYSFGITNKEFTISMPNKGANYLFTKAPTTTIRAVSPLVRIPGLPLYVFAELPETLTNVLNYSTSYIPIEVGTIRRGLNVMLDTFTNINKSNTVLQESYVHPAYGTLSLELGASDTDKELKTIYDSTYTSWYSTDNTEQVIIKQTINSDNVLLRGYMLNWRIEDKDSIPDTWTLTIRGVDGDGNSVTVVYDSVDQYYPFYSVEDDDIVYHCKFDNPVLVKSVTLTMSVKTPRKIALNKLYLYLSERYYSVSDNTMFLGNTPIRSAFLGTAVYDDNMGWKVNNTCIGRTCTVPINNLAFTEPYTSYVIPNPFNSTDIVATIQNYVLTDAEAEGVPDAYVQSVTPSHITVYSTQPFRYGLSIARTW